VWLFSLPELTFRRRKHMNIKKLTALLCAVVMVLSLAVGFFSSGVISIAAERLAL